MWAGVENWAAAMGDTFTKGEAKIAHQPDFVKLEQSQKEGNEVRQR